MEYLKRNLICRQCGADPTVNDYLEACHVLLPALNVITHTCTRCGKEDEIQVVDGELKFGRLCGGATPVFSTSDTTEVGGLSVEQGAGFIIIRHWEKEWIIPEIV